MRWTTYLCWLLACAALISWAADASTVMRPWNSGVRVIEDLSANYRPYPDRIPSAGPTAIAEWPLDGSGAGCNTSGTSCTETGSASDCSGLLANRGTLTCNSTTQVNHGTQSASIVKTGSSDWVVGGESQFASTTEIWAIVDIYFGSWPFSTGYIFRPCETGDTTMSACAVDDIIGISNGGSGTPGQLGVEFNGSSTAAAGCVNTAGSWSTIKMYFNTATSNIKLWCNGTDFTGAADYDVTHGTPASTGMTGFVSGQQLTFSAEDFIDRIRVFSSDPGAG